MSENKNIFTVENDYLKVEIDKIGGSLSSVIFKETGKEYLWQGDPNTGTRKLRIFFRLSADFSAVGSLTVEKATK